MLSVYARATHIHCVYRQMLIVYTHTQPIYTRAENKTTTHLLDTCAVIAKRKIKTLY